MLKKTSLPTLFLTSLLFLSSLAIGKNFIFDLGGVLIDTDPLASLHCIGLKNLAQCMISLKKGPHTINTHLKRKFFDILHTIAETSSVTPLEHYAYDEHGTPLPYYLCAWLAGTMKCSEIRQTLLSSIDMNPQWFNHPAEQKAIVNLISMVFTPEHFVTTRKLYPHGIGFIKACKKQGHKVYVLSNWDAESFALLKQKYPKLFDLFDGMIISGENNTVKPSPTIYALLLERYNLSANDCWFIDDQQENIVAACHAGIHGIVCPYTKWRKKPNFHHIAHIIKTNNLQISNTTRKS